MHMLHRYRDLNANSKDSHSARLFDDHGDHQGLELANLGGAAAFVFGAEDVGVPFDARLMVEQQGCDDDDDDDEDDDAGDDDDDDDDDGHYEYLSLVPLVQP